MKYMLILVLFSCTLILGCEKAQQQSSSNTKTFDSRVVGKWLDKSPLVGGQITIFYKDNKLVIKQDFLDGSSSTIGLNESKSPLGRKFTQASGSSYGDHWIIDSTGNLQIRDDNGLIATAKKTD